MVTGLADENGIASDALVEHYTQRANGVGLVIVEASSVESTSRGNLLGVDSDYVIPGLQRLVSAVQEQGSRIAIQLHYSGISTQSDTAHKSIPGPSPVSIPNSDVVMRELSIQEIEEIVVAFGQAAIRTKSAGFDAVEIHGAHGHLLNKFISPLTNKRTDLYGGSLRNRMRLPLEIVSAARNQVGADFPIIYRLGAVDMLPGGLTIQDGRRIAAALVEAGVNAIDVSGGHIGTEHPTLKGQGYFIPTAEEIKRAAKSPVICAGGVTDPAYADRVIRQGRVDMVAVGRAILDDPAWARKAVEMLSRNREQGCLH